MAKRKADPTPIRAIRMLTEAEQKAEQQKQLQLMQAHYSDEIRRRLGNVADTLAAQAVKITDLLNRAEAEGVPLTRRHVLPVMRDVLALIPRLDLNVLAEDAIDEGEWRVIGNMLNGKVPRSATADNFKGLPDPYYMTPGQTLQPNSIYMTTNEEPTILSRLGTAPNAEVAHEMAKIHAADLPDGVHGIYCTNDAPVLIQVKARKTEGGAPDGAREEGAPNGGN
jgi:hypothetical protein